jgi:hypothetical protein
VGEELEPVSPRIVGEEPTDARQRLIPPHRYAGCRQPSGNRLQIIDVEAQRGMRFVRRHERLLHADVKLSLADAKPDAAAISQQAGLVEFGQADQSAVEPARLDLASRWRGDLHMIKDGFCAHGLDRSARARLARSPKSSRAPITRAARLG